MWGLLYKGEKLFNPYHHFGQPTLWPRGYPLGSVGENITLEYELNHWKTPSIQQGVVNGDPDVDALFRLTRKQTHSQLNVTFDDRAPPAIVPAGVFSPFNSQNTLFLYDALWALLIPTTTTFRVCDIWRGYWAQRLLWEMGGHLGFFPPNAFQKRNSHSYLSDANDEKDLYFQTERLVTFLSKWRCGADKSFFDCVKQLSKDMCENNFWKESDVILTSVWIRDLNTIGYEEPKRVPLVSIPDKTLPIVNKRIQHQTRNTGEMSNVVFWAAEQTPPLTYSPEIQKTAVLSRLTKSASYCKNYPYNASIFDNRITINTFSNILLIVVFNFPHYQNLDLLETIYSMHFPNILYCGPRKDRFDAYAKHLTKHVSFIEVDVGDGWFAQNCLTQAMKINYNVDGYLYIGDDTLVNVWNLHNLPFDKLWLVKATVLQQSKKTEWPWFNSPRVGLKMYQAALNASKVLNKRRFDSFLQMLARNTKKVDGLLKSASDIAYVPRKYKNDVIYFMEHFSKFNLFVEITIPTVFAGIEKWENVHKMPGMYLWYDGKRKHVTKYFNKDGIFLHPVKLSTVLRAGKERQFLCGTYLPLTMRMSQKE
ncbi:uncharacterized protein [Haliotis cracherodii]|uniref:uncharacterized protein n=1 Tax=Haliotis cracherodii TaxID=6455 RepID=UPI0039ED87E8